MNRQNKLIVLLGVPGSGKSYWCNQYMEGHPDDTVHVTKDILRAMMHISKHSKSKENEVLAVRDFIIEQSLSIGKDLLIDDTNFSPKHLARIEELAAKHNAIVEIKSFTHVPLETCLDQNLKRSHPVREKVIRQMYNQYVKPKPVPPIYDSALPNALLCDLDGTLALFDRKAVNAYSRDFTKDAVNRPVYILLNQYNSPAILLTGRQEKDREQTELWLKMHDIPYDKLYMRQTDDKRSDYIVKEEIYNEHIKDKVNVLAVFDDRLQVCRLWYELGLPLFRVGDPDEDF